MRKLKNGVKKESLVLRTFFSPRTVPQGVVDSRLCMHGGSKLDVGQQASPLPDTLKPWATSRLLKHAASTMVLEETFHPSIRSERMTSMTRGTGAGAGGDTHGWKMPMNGPSERTELRASGYAPIL